MSSPNPDPNQSRDQAPPSSQSSSPSILVNLTKPENPQVSTKFAPRTGAKLITSAVAVAVVLTGAFIVVQVQRSRRESELQDNTTTTANAPVTVDVVPVKYGAETQQLQGIDGHVHAWYETTIYARVNGYLHGWKADIGDHVAKDDVLATIDTPELDDQLAAAQAKLKVSQAEVVVKQAETDFAYTQYVRWRDATRGLVSDQDRQEKSAEYDSSKAQLEAAKSQVTLDQADVNSLTELAGFQQVRAPFDGVITGRHIDIGDLVTAGSTASTTPLYSIAQYDKVRVFVDVPQNLSTAMAVDTSATITASEFPGRKFEGKVARTSSALDQASRTLHVEVDVPNTDLTLLPGMYVYVKFEIKQSPLLEVPASALLFRTNGPQVAVVDQSGRVSFHDVVIGGDQGDLVEIASGLSLNDRVALNLSSQIAEGDHVTATAVDNVSASAPTR